MQNSTSILRIVLPAILLSLFGTTTSATEKNTEWTHYGGSQKGLQYSDLDQIDKSNVHQLKIAWTFRTGELNEGAREKFSFQSNPVLVNNKLYVSTGSGIVFALEPESGKEIWRHNPGLDRSRTAAEISNRGVSSWNDPAAPSDSACAHRIFIGLLDSRLLALDGVTGKPCKDFGRQGEIFLNENVRLRETGKLEYAVTSPPIIVGDTLISGSAIGDNGTVEMELGIVRGFDARTGAERWRWDPLPRSASRAKHTEWLPDQVNKTGAANAWAPLAADVERNLVFVPTGSASPDFYGGERKGDNRWANSLVALNAHTGALVWGQQLVHHDVWDYDLASQPTLVELEREGRKIPAVIQATKTGLIYTFNRETGEPLFAIEERAVPQGGVPGEHLSPTQPFPVAPPPIVRQHSVGDEQAWGLMLFDKLGCKKKFAALRSEGIYTPPSLQGSVMLPGYAGGVNWGGLAFDPKNQFAVLNATELAMEIALIPRDKFEQLSNSNTHPDSEFAPQSGTPYGMRREPITSVLGVPCLQPPWGTTTLVNMAEGTIVWQVAMGTIEDLAPAPVPNMELGTPLMGGPIITAGGLVFTGAAMDDYLRGLDISTGEELWKGRLPAGGQATPMTYYLESTKKQYIVIAAGGHPGLGTTAGDFVVAFSL